MSIHVENNLKNTENKQVLEQRAHFVPCKVEEDGAANVDTYFEPYVVDESGVLSATFRGHSLDGTSVSLPEGYRAVVITEAKRPLSENTERRFQEPESEEHIGPPISDAVLVENIKTEPSETPDNSLFNAVVKQEPKSEEHIGLPIFDAVLVENIKTEHSETPESWIPRGLHLRALGSVRNHLEKLLADDTNPSYAYESCRKTLLQLESIHERQLFLGRQRLIAHLTRLIKKRESDVNKIRTMCLNTLLKLKFELQIPHVGRQPNLVPFVKKEYIAPPISDSVLIENIKTDDSETLESSRMQGKPRNLPSPGTVRNLLKKMTEDGQDPSYAYEFCRKTLLELDTMREQEINVRSYRKIAQVKQLIKKRKSDVEQIQALCFEIMHKHGVEQQMPLVDRPPKRRNKKNKFQHKIRHKKRSYQAQDTWVDILHIRNKDPMSNEELQIVKALIIKEMLNKSPIGTYPTYRRCSIELRDGWLLIKCINQTTRDFLIKLVGNLKPWPEAELSLMTNYKIALVFVPNLEAETVEEFLKMLENANEGLNTQAWEILESKVVPDGLQLTIHLDSQSVEALRKVDCMPSVRYKKVKFILKDNVHQNVIDLTLDSQQDLNVASSSQIFSDVTSVQQRSFPNIETSRETQNDQGNRSTKSTGQSDIGSTRSTPQEARTDEPAPSGYQNTLRDRPNDPIQSEVDISIQSEPGVQEQDDSEDGFPRRRSTNVQNEKCESPQELPQRPGANTPKRKLETDVSQDQTNKLPRLEDQIVTTEAHSTLVMRPAPKVNTTLTSISLKTTPVHRIGIRNKEPMTEEQLELVRSKILEAIAEINEPGTGPTFLGYSFSHGQFFTDCTNKYSQDWLIRLVNYFKLWPEAELSIIIEPKTTIGLVFVRKSEAKTVEQFLKMVENQNKGLHTRIWEVLESRVVLDGLLLAIHLDNRSVEALRKVDNMPYLGFKKVKFILKENAHQNSIEPQASTLASQLDLKVASSSQTNSKGTSIQERSFPNRDTLRETAEEPELGSTRQVELITPLEPIRLGYQSACRDQPEKTVPETEGGWIDKLMLLYFGENWAGPEPQKSWEEEFTRPTLHDDRRDERLQECCCQTRDSTDI